MTPPPPVPQPRRPVASNLQDRANGPAPSLEQGAVYGIPVRELGATGVLNCKFWSTDLRERLDANDPLREDFEKSPADGSPESVERLAKLHDITLRLTTIDR